VRRPGGKRTIPAADFFRGFLETAVAPDELPTEIRWGAHLCVPPRWSSAWRRVRRSPRLRSARRRRPTRRGDLNGSSSARWRPRLAEFLWMAFVDHRLHRMAGDDGRFSPSSP